jgi:hypothetical protein
MPAQRSSGKKKTSQQDPKQATAKFNAKPGQRHRKAQSKAQSMLKKKWLLR